MSLPAKNGLMISSHSGSSAISQPLVFSSITKASFKTSQYSTENLAVHIFAQRRAGFFLFSPAASAPCRLPKSNLHRAASFGQCPPGGLLHANPGSRPLENPTCPPGQIEHASTWRLLMGRTKCMDRWWPRERPASRQNRQWTFISWILSHFRKFRP